TNVTGQRVRDPGERLHPGLRIQAFEATDHGHAVQQRNVADPNSDKTIRQVRRKIVRPPPGHRGWTDRTGHHELLPSRPPVPRSRPTKRLSPALTWFSARAWHIGPGASGSCGTRFGAGRGSDERRRCKPPPAVPAGTAADPRAVGPRLRLLPR